MEQFAELGQSIESAWRKTDYDEALLPGIAADLLRRADMPSKVSAWEVIDWVLSQDELPAQKDVHANFGEPPITVFSSPRFFIDVYFWFAGTTALHQHGFSGAFQVLAGSSIHSHYSFETEKRVNTFFSIGKTSLEVCELLEVGRVQEINAGEQYIHSLFHLDHPSATIVVRTDKSPLHLPQFSYHKPSVAVDPFFAHDTTTKKLQSIAALFIADREDAVSKTADLIRQVDMHTAYTILMSLVDRLGATEMDRLFNKNGEVDKLDQLVAATAETHPELGSVIADVIAHRQNETEIVRRRSYVTDAELRFFLAILLNVDGRENVFSLIKQKYPEVDPLERTLDWIEKLAAMRPIGSNLPNILGIEGFGDMDITIVESLLHGKNDAEALASFRAMFDASKQEEVDEDFRNRALRIRNAVLLGPLMRP